MNGTYAHSYSISADLTYMAYDESSTLYAVVCYTGYDTAAGTYLDSALNHLRHSL